MGDIAIADGNAVTSSLLMFEGDDTYWGGMELLAVNKSMVTETVYPLATFKPEYPKEYLGKIVLFIGADC